MSAPEDTSLAAHPVVWAHPRRIVSELSVSLRKASVSQVECSASADASSVTSDKLSNGNVSEASRVAASGEQPVPPVIKRTETYNADKWFDESNRNAGGEDNVRIIDDDPPFYMRKQQLRGPNAEKSRGQNSDSQSELCPAPMQGLHTAIESNGSSREDYRSVIDDLTIENQELKRKLRKYEGLRSTQMQDDKLFELRVYKLSQTRRRRLERMLRDFVSNIGRSPPESISSGTYPPMASIPYHHVPVVNKQRSSSSTSNKPVDSAYASMSASGAPSVTQLQTGRDAKRPVPSLAEKPQPPKDQRVQSYLQTISRRLLPKYPPVMTDKTKKKLVVKRLEQLFVGRSGSASKHSQSVQQQEVSQSAAIADRRASEALGHRVQAEGRREAKMYRPSQLTKIESKDMGALPPDDSPGGINGTGATPDQRPTRPLDLDPSRAQNPVETINYMKHLGFGSPKMDANQPPHDEEGWIFLNLLINMAQLHTLNVTPGFVRNAVQELSSSFELSEDGHDIRWRGGPRGSKLSSESSCNSDESNESFGEENAPGQLHSQSGKGLIDMKDTIRPRHHQNRHGPRPVRNWPWPHTGQHFYSPLFYNPEEGNSGSPTQEGVSSNSIYQIEERSGGVSGGSRSLENTKTSSKMNDDGETGNLTFYRRARFCTDLKGDPTFPPSNEVYEKRVQHVLPSDMTVHRDVPNSEVKGLLSYDNLHLSTTYLDTDSEKNMTGFEPPLSTMSNGPLPAEPIILTASGVGGVTPADNFCTHIRREYCGNTATITAELTKKLKPTPLPPPSYAFLPYSSSSDTEDSDIDDDDVVSDDGALGRFTVELNERHFVPPMFLSEFSSQSTRPQRSHATSEESSLDMLEFARKADPERVAAQEREYESHVRPERMNLSGSVAATVGDRSTFFTSQEDNASLDERHRRLVQDRQVTGLKRERSEWGGSQRTSKHKRLDGSL